MRQNLIIFILLPLLGGCGRRSDQGDPVHIVVTPGFQGFIQIIVDGADSGGYRHVNGRHEYVIPESGVLHVKTAEPFERWHKLSATDTAGLKIYTEEPIPAAAIMIDGLGTSVSNQGPPTEWYAVGTPEFVGRAQKWFYRQSDPRPTTTPASGTHPLPE